MADIKSFPNNQDEYVGAETVMRWLHGRTSGVYGADGNVAVEAVQGAMAVTVTDGVGWMANTDGDGVVWWNDHYASAGAKLRLSLDAADATLDRIDRVVVTWQTTDYVALPTISIARGTPASSPQAPGLANDSTRRQISLARIRVPAGALSVTPAMITDERLDPSVCGLVTAGIRVDTSVMNAQFMSWFAGVQNTLSGDVAGNLLAMINGLNSNKLDRVGGLTQLLNDGPMVLSANQYGTALPANPVEGQIFFLIGG